MRNVFLLILLTLAVAACEQTVIPAELDKSFAPVRIQCQVDAVQPGTGLVLWSENASNRHAAYGKAISLEYAYCLPSQVVTGKDNGVVRYDWSSFNSWLKDVARGQAGNSRRPLPRKLCPWPSYEAPCLF